MAGLGKAAGYVPEPDVALIENDPDQRIVEAPRLLAEIVSSTDEAMTLEGGRPWIDVKAALYRQHAPCQAVLVVEQERVAARLWLKVGTTWSETILSASGDVLAIASCGLRCTLGELCTHIHLAPAAATRTKRR